MTDELTEMNRANPISPDVLDRVVAMDRHALFELLEADSRGRGPRLRGLARGSRRPATRVGYVGAMVAAAAAVLGIALIGPDDPPPATDPGVTAAEITPTTPLVIDGVDSSEPASTDVGAGSAASEGTRQTTTTTALDAVGRLPLPDGPFDRSTDLLVLHYDHADLDDGLSAAAAMEITTAFGVHTLVVSGTTVADFDGYVPPSEPVMRAAWGDEWLDANTDRAGARRRSVERWLTTLDGGGQVWVAEGGVSDFTAEVLREVTQQRPNLDLGAAIHIVQHSRSNESRSTPEQLEFVRTRTAYEQIDDGNSANDTADLNQPSAAFETAALNGRHGAIWSVAFDYLPAAELDFSDTVEVLHILGVTIDEVADPDDFARFFLN